MRDEMVQSANVPAWIPARLRFAPVAGMTRGGLACR